MSFTIEQIQSLINQKSLDARQLVNLIADYLQANPGGGGASYLVYTALLHQTNVNLNPIAEVFTNTLGGSVVWTMLFPGKYQGTLAGAFTIDKTIIPPFGDSNTQTYLPVSSNSVAYYQAYGADSDNIYVTVFTDLTLTTPVDLYSVIGNSKIFIEIRVYP